MSTSTSRRESLLLLSCSRRPSVAVRAARLVSAAEPSRKRRAEPGVAGRPQVAAARADARAARWQSEQQLLQHAEGHAEGHTEGALSRRQLWRAAHHTIPEQSEAAGLSEAARGAERPQRDGGRADADAVAAHKAFSSRIAVLRQGALCSEHSGHDDDARVEMRAAASWQSTCSTAYS